MPVRVYDLAKKLGVESKDLLAKASELGITQAKNPSSSLDRITAEFLEQQFTQLAPPAVALPARIPTIAQVPNPPSATVPPSSQQSKTQGVSFRANGAEIYGLVERILLGDIPFVIEVSRDEASPPLRAKLVPEAPQGMSVSKRNVETAPRAELDDHAKRIFLGAFYWSNASHDGWVNLAEYGNTLKKQDPTFQPQDFGEKSLGGLIRRIGIFDIKAEGTALPVYYIRLKPNAVAIPLRPAAAPSQDSTQPRRQMTGRVHNLKLGFGFIAPDDGSENAFFHASEVIGCTIFDLRPGDPVEYEAGENERGPCAWKIRRTPKTTS